MAFRMPFGQYIEGDTLVHRTDARVKLVVTGAYFVALFTVSGWPGLGLLAVVCLAVIAAAHIPVARTLHGLRPVVWLLLFTLVVNGARWNAPGMVLSFGPIGFDGEGLARGAFYSFRIVLLMLGASIMTFTTSPVTLTDAISAMLLPLRRVRVPVDDIAMMLSIALRFMPTTAEEVDRVMMAQAARGAKFDVGGPVARTRAWLPVLVPVFVNLFRRADDLAIAMEARCYSGQGRTRLRELRIARTDVVVLVIGLAAATAIGVVL